MKYLLLIAMLLPLAAFGEAVEDLGTASDHSELMVNATQENAFDDLNLLDQDSDSFNFGTYGSYYPYFYYGYYPCSYLFGYYPTFFGSCCGF